MATTTAGLTVAEFLKLPDPPAGRNELRQGEVVHVPPAKRPRTVQQKRLLHVLLPHLDALGMFTVELPFRIGDRNFRTADLGFVAAARWNATSGEDYFPSAPDLVIEVLSASNTVREISEKEQLCIANGCLQFWVVDGIAKTIKVSTPDRITRTYLEDESISLAPLTNAEVAVAEVFSRIG